MNKKLEHILKLAHRFESLGQIVSVEAADIQVALGQGEKTGTFRNAGGGGYYSQDNINNIITDFCNKLNIPDDVKGSVDINYVNGAVSYVVRLTDPKKSQPLAKYLQTKYSTDMSRKIAMYLKSKNKAATGSITANWIRF